MSRYDLVVVGAGILGLAVAREWLARHDGAHVLVVEAEAGVAAHQTGHNSGVIHSGIYYQPGSLKAKLCVEGSRLMYDFIAENDIAFERCGKLIVALDRDELARLDDLESRGRANQVVGLRRIGAEEIREIEPRAVGLAALHSPETGIVDYAQVARAIHRQLEAAGVEFRFGTRAESVSATSDGCRVHLGDDVVDARRAITCAGLWSDRLAQASGGGADPRIVPFRGGYLQLRPRTEPFVRGMIYPVPDPTLPFLGVHITKHIDSSVSLGPTAMMVPSRDGYTWRKFSARDAWQTGTWPPIAPFWTTPASRSTKAPSAMPMGRCARSCSTRPPSPIPTAAWAAWWA